MPKPAQYYESLIADMPVGAERVVLRILSHHIGLANAAEKAYLLNACATAGAVFSNERQLRLTIVKLRKAGVPVCASSGESGYYLNAMHARMQQMQLRLDGV